MLLSVEEITTRYYIPKVQEIVEELQGVLKLLSGRDVGWFVDESGNTYEIRFFIEIDNVSRYTSSQIVSKHALDEISALHWPSFKRSIVMGVLRKMVEDSKPVDAKEVTYWTTPGAE